MRNAATGEGTILARSAKRVRFRFCRMVARAWELRSTKVTASAPRESASMPRAPVPAYRSSTAAPGTSDAMLENRPSLAMSETGRTPRGTGASRTPFAVPAITRMERL